MVECDAKLDFKKKCELLNVSRGSMYYKPKAVENNDTILVNEIQDIFHEKPFYGYRRIAVELRKQGYIVNHKKVQRLLRQVGIQAIYPTKNTSKRNFAQAVHPYLLKGLTIERPNQVWQVDITYIKIREGFVYLVCFIDIFSRKIMSWNVSTFLNTSMCLNALHDALKEWIPEIINSDQGCQFTSESWCTELKKWDIAISMDGKGRWADNVYVERLWRTIKRELIYLYSFDTVDQVKKAITTFICFYNKDRHHQSLNYHTPDDVFKLKHIPTKQELYTQFMNACIIQPGVAAM